nr:MAG TPA: hypothetical protein [Caudoviricetes sp.]
MVLQLWNVNKITLTKNIINRQEVIYEYYSS